MASRRLTFELILGSLGQILSVHLLKDLDGHHLHPKGGAVGGENLCQLWPAGRVHLRLGKAMQLMWRGKGPQQSLELAQLFLPQLLQKRPQVEVHSVLHGRVELLAMDYRMATREKELLLFATAWRDLQRSLLSETSQQEKDDDGVISLIGSV